MVFVKILSSLVIVMCCSFLGLQAANAYALRVKELRMLRMAFAQLESEVINYATFLPEAVERVAALLHGGVKEFFCDFSRRLQKRSGDTAAEAWEKALKGWKKHLHITMEDTQILLTFGKVLGVSDRESQQRYFQIIQSQLRNQEQKAEEACLKYQTMYRNLGVLGGLALAIILL
ncbi:MAG: stage sporulation protein [Clostridiales bacterium]|jgi:stage III sporulation protein AB|nr:stage sporulation protein [Clostridiales bacterium]